MERMAQLVAEIQGMPPHCPGDTNLSPPVVLVCCTSPPAPYESPAIEAALNATLPGDIIGLWAAASEIRLWEDVNYGQWGCILWSPTAVAAGHDRAAKRLRPDDLRTGDVIIGEFRGDSDHLILRCDRDAIDFGSVVVALPIDRRCDWYRAADSLEDFMRRFLASPDRKYWEAEAQTLGV